ncbi:hypothetical protein SAMN05444266_109331 [Chitinophaga jiangningensis]|uniref:Uncharacterized protein n=2 Tax=Chitinophaga jiangningensis TaxID=1419482 RepID=A0A1M7KIU3_9BACT|nr:hypothetical protein SAMN05444266_109331 [Chitinophaga jiangningensis]
MKKAIYALILPLVVISGLVFAYDDITKGTAKKSTPKPHTAEEIKAERKRWETTPAGIMFKQWEASPEGNKVLSAAAKIGKEVRDAANMEAVVTSLTLPPGSRVGFGLMVSIKGNDYILSFGAENAYNEFQQLHTLKVNDKIILRSRGVSYAPKYPYPIVFADYVERDSKIIYKRVPHGDGC